MKARARAGRRGWVGAAGLAIALIGWIWFVVRPSDLIVPLWVASVVGMLWIGQKVCRELLYGADRFMNRRAAEAVPPESPPSPPESPQR